MLNTLSHPFDYLRWLLGEVETLGAQLAHLSALELSVEDHADISLKFASGAMASVHLDYYQNPIPIPWISPLKKGVSRGIMQGPAR